MRPAQVSWVQVPSAAAVYGLVHAHTPPAHRTQCAEFPTCHIDTLLTGSNLSHRTRIHSQLRTTTCHFRYHVSCHKPAVHVPRLKSQTCRTCTASEASPVTNLPYMYRISSNKPVAHVSRLQSQTCRADTVSTVDVSVSGVAIWI